MNFQEIHAHLALSAAVIVNSSNELPLIKGFAYHHDLTEYFPYMTHISRPHMFIS